MFLVDYVTSSGTMSVPWRFQLEQTSALCNMGKLFQRVYCCLVLDSMWLSLLNSIAEWVRISNIHRKYRCLCDYRSLFFSPTSSWSIWKREQSSGGTKPWQLKECLLRGTASYQMRRTIGSHMTLFPQATCSETSVYALVKKLTAVQYSSLWPTFGAMFHAFTQAV